MVEREVIKTIRLTPVELQMIQENILRSYHFGH